MLSMLLAGLQGCAQEDPRFRVMFYNVENLFDTADDTLTNDEEFLPEGMKQWDEHKMYKKINRIYKVILHCGEWEPPALVGLCEVENREVLENLVYDTPLKKYEYRIVHFDSPDRRGIDVALLFRKALFEPDTAFAVPVRFPFDPDSRTRDILYVKGHMDGTESLHVFVNHWPSRYGGYEATIPKRNRAAAVLKQVVDSILHQENNANILIMGDFNDGPLEESIVQTLGAMPDTADASGISLFNPTAVYEDVYGTGTLKYKENWDVFDQIILSVSMRSGENGLKMSGRGVQIFRTDYLVEEDARYLGVKPFRTYAGPRYLDGYSDHLPVYVDLETKQ